MQYLLKQLELERCPHCRVDKPSVNEIGHFVTQSFDGGRERNWKVYSCTRCGGAIIAGSSAKDGYVQEMYPSNQEVDDDIPDLAKSYLRQALDTLHAPAGSVMLSASAVDAMLKAKGYKEGKLFIRINQAKQEHVITDDMALWAHEVRLDANEPRHADEKSPLPSEKDARKSVDFALALGHFLFVLPARVSRGLSEAKKSDPASVPSPPDEPFHLDSGRTTGGRTH